MAEISVIVPVYNVEKYLKRCLDSIICQSYSDLEIILVNDGSTDNSGLICNQYKERDQRIHVIHKNNGGLSDARNAGLRIATGNYISFIDSDDWIDNDFLEKLYITMSRVNVDVVSCKYRIVKENENVIVHSFSKINLELLNTNDLMKRYLKGIISGRNEDASCCIKLYKKEIFETHSFRDGMLFEDVIFNWEVMNSNKRYAFVDYNGYNYFIRKKSITQGEFTENIFDLEKGAELMGEFYTQNDIQIIELLKQYKSKATFSVLIKMLKTTGVKPELLKNYIKKVKENFNILIKSSMKIEKKIVLCVIYVLNIELMIYIYKFKNLII